MKGTVVENPWLNYRFLFHPLQAANGGAARRTDMNMKFHMKEDGKSSISRIRTEMSEKRERERERD